MKINDVKVVIGSENQDFQTTGKHDDLTELRNKIYDRAKEAGVTLDGPFVYDAVVDCDGHGRRTERAIFLDRSHGVHVFPTTYRGENQWIAAILPTDYNGIWSKTGHGEEQVEDAITNALTALVELRLA